MVKIAKPAPSLPANYDPDIGIKSVAIAEAAEKHFRRAKDATRLLEAVELKLAEQRKFVLWWDQAKHGGEPRPGRTSISLTGDIATLAQLGVDISTIHRWRTRLKDIKKYDTTLERAQASCIKVCEARSGHSDNARMTNTGEVEWYTPSEYLEAARDVLGEFDLDPATSEIAQRTVKAGRYFTREDDGLSQEWAGRVWLNPPYQQPDISHFVTKLVQSCEAGSVQAAILLTNNSTDTTWFHQAVGACSALCFTRGRIQFLTSAGEGGSPLQGQAFFYYGLDVEAFRIRFASIGFVVKPL